MSVAGSGVPSAGTVLLSTLHHMEYNNISSTVNNMMVSSANGAVEATTSL